jgi:hypothetical protein
MEEEKNPEKENLPNEENSSLNQPKGESKASLVDRNGQLVEPNPDGQAQEENTGENAKENAQEIDKKGIAAKEIINIDDELKQLVDIFQPSLKHTNPKLVSLT